MGKFESFSLFNSVIKVFLINLWVVVLIVRKVCTHSDRIMLCDFVMLHVIANAAIEEFYAV